MAKSLRQQEEIDYNKIFSPEVKHTFIRLLLAIVTCENLELKQIDVTKAFLHGRLEEKIYLDQPRGFEAKGKKDLVCKLNRSLHGLKQSPRCWYKCFDDFMIKINFPSSLYDACVHYRKKKIVLCIFLTM